MISEESCDTEDWSNDAEDSALASQEYIYLFLYTKNYLKSLLCIRDTFQKQ